MSESTPHVIYPVATFYDFDGTVIVHNNSKPDAGVSVPIPATKYLEKGAEVIAKIPQLGLKWSGPLNAGTRVSVLFSEPLVGDRVYFGKVLETNPNGIKINFEDDDTHTVGEKEIFHPRLMSFEGVVQDFIDEDGMYEVKLAQDGNYETHFVVKTRVSRKLTDSGQITRKRKLGLRFGGE